MKTDMIAASRIAIGLSTNAQGLSVFDGSNSAVHIIIDVTGYFQ
jgi:hypothetical protein